MCCLVEQNNDSGQYLSSVSSSGTWPGNRKSDQMKRMRMMFCLEKQGEQISEPVTHSWCRISILDCYYYVLYFDHKLINDKPR